MSSQEILNQAAQLSQSTDFQLFDDFEFDSELLDSFFEGTVCDCTVSHPNTIEITYTVCLMTAIIVPHIRTGMT